MSLASRTYFKLHTLLIRMLKTAGFDKLAWKMGHEDELKYWVRYIREEGMQWHEIYLDRLNPDQPLQEPVRECLEHLEKDRLDILDVGAGPMTMLGKRMEGKTLRIVAVDPLAPQYNEVIREQKLSPPVPTTEADAETLDEQFEPESFDLVHARNCIDHSYDAPRAIEQMLRLARPGCYVYMEHAINEAESNFYHGLHQWNFREEDGAFVIANRKGEINMTERLKGRADTTTEVIDDHWLICKILKKG